MFDTICLLTFLNQCQVPDVDRTHHFDLCHPCQRYSLLLAYQSMNLPHATLEALLKIKEKTKFSLV